MDEERIFQTKLKKEADAEAHIYGGNKRAKRLESAPFSSRSRFSPFLPRRTRRLFSPTRLISIAPTPLHPGLGDKEKFVTAAYKEKLAEMGRWKAEDARLQALETATTVRTQTCLLPSPEPHLLARARGNSRSSSSGGSRDALVVF